MVTVIGRFLQYIPVLERGPVLKETLVDRKPHAARYTEGGYRSAPLLFSILKLILSIMPLFNIFC